jgi:hypothetical protein
MKTTCSVLTLVNGKVVHDAGVVPFDRRDIRRWASYRRLGAGACLQAAYVR